MTSVAVEILGRGVISKQTRYIAHSVTLCVGEKRSQNKQQESRARHVYEKEKCVPELRDICEASELLREWPEWVLVVPVPASELSDLLSSSIILKTEKEKRSILMMRAANWQDERNVLWMKDNNMAGGRRSVVSMTRLTFSLCLIPLE